MQLSAMPLIPRAGSSCRATPRSASRRAGCAGPRRTSGRASLRPAARRRGPATRRRDRGRRTRRRSLRSGTRQRGHWVAEHRIGRVKAVHDRLDDLQHCEGGDAAADQRAENAPAFQLGQKLQPHGAPRVARGSGRMLLLSAAVEARSMTGFGFRFFSGPALLAPRIAKECPMLLPQTFRMLLPLSALLLAESPPPSPPPASFYAIPIGPSIALDVAKKVAAAAAAEARKNGWFMAIAVVYP